jgi:hypothetical protein
MAQAVMCCRSRAEMRVNAKVTPSGICCRQSDNGEGLVLSIYLVATSPLCLICAMRKKVWYVKTQL